MSCSIPIASLLQALLRGALVTTDDAPGELSSYPIDTRGYWAGAAEGLFARKGGKGENQSLWPARTAEAAVKLFFLIGAGVGVLRGGEREPT